MGHEGVDWNHLIQDKVQSWAIVNTDRVNGPKFLNRLSDLGEFLSLPVTQKYHFSPLLLYLKENGEDKSFLIVLYRTLRINICEHFVINVD
jgi:hypothetical protein